MAIVSFIYLVLVSILSPTYGKEINRDCSIDVSLTNSAIANATFVRISKSVTAPPSPIPSFNPNVTGSLARAKCIENADFARDIVKDMIISDDNYDIVSESNKTKEELVNFIKKMTVKAKEFPYMAALGYDNGDIILWQCGGSLISPNIVLTSAHCTDTEFFGIPKFVKVGNIDLTRLDKKRKQQVVEIEQIIKHPKYQKPSLYDDIAILRLKYNVVYDEWVRPACLPFNYPEIEERATVTGIGWDVIDWIDHLVLSNLFRQRFRILPHLTCKQIYPYGSKDLGLGILSDRQICASRFKKDFCVNADEGLLVASNKEYDGVYDLLGIANIDHKCKTGVYTRVYHYIKWIERIAWPEYF